MKPNHLKMKSLFTTAILLGAIGQASAGTISTTNNTNANALAAALTSGGAGGITITSATLSTNTLGAAAGSGIYTTAGPGGNNFQLTGTGIVISSGNAAQTGTSGAFINSVTTAYGSVATAAQDALLDQVASAGSWRDVTALTVTFDVDANTSAIFFNGVFASAEYPVYVNQFVDGFGLFLNGTNIAFAGGFPTNINSPLMVNTGFPVNGGVNGSAFHETPIGGLLVNNGSPIITYSGLVTPGSTGNTLVFIIADANDTLLDTTAFIQGLGNAVPQVPEPASLTLFGLGIAGMAGYRLRRRKQAVTA